MELPIKLNEATGRYELLNGGWLSSPSRILRPLTVDKYKAIPKHYLAMAATFGKQAHSNVEMFEELGHDEFAESEVREMLFSGNHENVFNQYLKWKVENDVKVLEVEKVVYNLDDRYFGYIDNISIVNGKKTIVDLKTRSKLGSDDNYLTETLQLMLYRDAYFKMTGEKVEIALLVINKKTKSKKDYIVIDKVTRTKLRKLLNALKRANVEKIAYDEQLEKEKQNGKI